MTVGTTAVGGTLALLIEEGDRVRTVSLGACLLGDTRTYKAPRPMTIIGAVFWPAGSDEGVTVDLNGTVDLEALDTYTIGTVDFRSVGHLHDQDE